MWPGKNVLLFSVRRALETRNVQPAQMTPAVLETYDYRGKQPLEFKGPGRLRDPNHVVAVCCHQTGIEYGAQKAHVRKYDIIEAHHRRFWSTEKGCGVPYHVVGTRTWHTLLVSNVLAYKYHGDRLSGDSIGWAAEGRFPEVESKRTSKHTELTDERVRAWQHSLRTTIRHGLEAGCRLQYVWAHRQGDGGKPGDPGEELWRYVVAPVAAEFGLRSLPKMTRTQPKGKPGKPLPEEWTRWESPTRGDMA